VKPFTAVALPWSVVTTTSAAPGACGGVVATTWLAVTAPRRAAVPPKVTLFVPLKNAPVIATLCPPAALPLAGDIPVRPGKARY
jgi:hypothetical protein